eukprot:GILK01005486.1.p1 GENE.GILK01005486.1~~GILK01005486.1.p1  ORF type:complete len:330 (+),score=32.56 GILK01005486.1:45-1034(+)
MAFMLRNTLRRILTNGNIARHHGSVRSTTIRTHTTMTSRNFAPAADEFDRGNSTLLSSGVAALMHPGKLHRNTVSQGVDWSEGGEDALFVSRNGRVVGVADGVGTSTELLQSGLFSHLLMEEGKRVADEEGVVDPQVILQKAYDYICKRRVAGSSTACVVSLDPSKSVLRAVNLGDSGFMVIRGIGSAKVQLTGRSEPMCHYFNCPFQLAIEGQDTPAAARSYEIPTGMGDMILLGTDGLFNNMFDEEILDHITQWGCQQVQHPHSFRPEAFKALAEDLAKISQRNAADSRKDTPHHRDADRENYILRPGESMDDVTIIISRVCPATTH